MNCQEIKSAIAKHFEEERLGQLPREYLQHIKNCPSCQEYYRKQQSLDSAIKNLAGAKDAEDFLRQISDDLKENVLRNVSASKQKSLRIKRWAVVAAAVLIFTAGLWLVPRLRENRPAEEILAQSNFYLRSARIGQRPANTIVYQQERQQTPLIVWLY